MPWAIKRAAAPCRLCPRQAARRERLPPPGPHGGIYRSRVLGYRQADQLRHRCPGGIRGTHAGASPRRPDWYISEDGITLEKLPFLDPRTGAPSAKEDFKPAVGRLSYTRSPSEARDRICRAWALAAPPAAGQKVQRSVPDGHQHGRDPQLPGVPVPVHPAPA